MSKLFLAALLLSPLAQAENVIDIQHDTARGIPCYILNGVGISCIPDSQLKEGAKKMQAPADQVDGERYSM
jgi:hypothetical protein